MNRDKYKNIPSIPLEREWISREEAEKFWPNEENVLEKVIPKTVERRVEESLIGEFRTQWQQGEVEAIESVLAPVIRKMIEIYGINGVRRALKWIILQLNKKQ